MRTFLIVASLMILVVILAHSQFLPEREAQYESHTSSSKECAICHYEWTEPFLTLRIGTPIAEYPETREVGDERMCFSCHDGSVGDARFLLWSPQGENHKTGTVLKPEMNPPAVLPLEDGKITCMTCHSAHGTGEIESGRIDSSIETSVFLRLPNNESQLCKSCHDDMADSMSHPMRAMTASQLENFQPGVVELAAGNMVVCTSCHEPHGAPSTHLLRASGEGMELCRSCHTDKFPNDNPDRDDLAIGHLVTLEVDDVNIQETILRNSGRLGADGELICFSCHTLHNAEASGLLNRDNTDSAFCRECHFDQDNIFESPHNMTRRAGYETINGKSSMDVGVCSSCHGAHTWQRRLPAITVDNEMTRMCLSCHEPGGVAVEKPIMWDKFNHFTGDIQNILQEMLDNPQMAQLPENTQVFLDEYFDFAIPRTMLTPSTVTCMACHNIHESEAGGGKFLREEIADGTLCLHCHEDQRAVAGTDHGTAKLTQSCISCHSVHNSDAETLVREYAGNDGCTACHTTDVQPDTAKYLLEPMPVELTVRGYNHPVNVDNSTAFSLPVKQRTDGRFTCTSCHNPHASQDGVNPVARNFLWVDDDTDTMDKFCTTCHDAQRSVIVSDHAPPLGDTVVVNQRTGRLAESCDTCHTAHNSAVEKYVFAVSGSFDSNDSYCTVCHSAGSTAGYMAAQDKAIDVMRGHTLGVLDDTPEVTAYLSMENGVYKIECFNCHDPHINGPAYGTEGHFNSSFVKTLDPDKNFCLSCHESKETIVSGGHFTEKFELSEPRANPEYSAEIALMQSTGDICGICHTLHNSPREYLMDGVTAEERCMACHKQDELSVMAVINSHESEVTFSDNNTANLPLENEKIVCSTCHEPHSQSVALMRLTAANTEVLCMSCHESKLWVALSKHNMLISDVNDEELVQRATENACKACHSPHNYPPGGFLMWPREIAAGRDFIESACVDCHKTGGVAAAKVPQYLNHSRVLRMFPLQSQYRELLRGFDGRMSEDGDISCTTCHDPHVWSTDPDKLYEAEDAADVSQLDGDNTTSFLKASVVNGFCDVCHNDAQERYAKFHDADFRRQDNDTRGLLNGLLNRLFN